MDTTRKKGEEADRPLHWAPVLEKTMEEDLKLAEWKTWNERLSWLAQDRAAWRRLWLTSRWESEED